MTGDGTNANAESGLLFDGTNLSIGGAAADKLDVYNGNARIRVGGTGVVYLQNDGSNNAQLGQISFTDFS